MQLRYLPFINFCWKKQNQRDNNDHEQSPQYFHDAEAWVHIHKHFFILLLPNDYLKHINRIQTSSRDYKRKASFLHIYEVQIQ